MQSIAFFGQNTALSYLEISKLQKTLGIKFRVEEIFPSCFLIDHPEELPEIFLESLGGMVKFSRLLDTWPSYSKEALEALLESEAQGKEGFVYGISCYDVADDKATQIRSHALKYKLPLRSLVSGKLRCVESKEPILSSVIVKKEKLLSDIGAEFVFVFSAEKVLLGKTYWVQDFKRFGHFDAGRPKIDLRSGILPSKLARMFINIGRQKSDTILFDPFCGSGTVLQEGVLLGFSRVVGMDISARAINDSEENMAWLKNEASEFASVETKLYLSDNAQASAFLSSDSVDLVVFEPYMGPTLRAGQRVDYVSIKEEIEKQLFSCFRELSKIIRPGAHVSCVFPVIHEFSGKKYTMDFGVFEKNGFELDYELSPWEKKALQPFFSSRSTLVYDRNNKLVAREFLLLKKRS